MSAATAAGEASARGNAFSWRFVTPLYLGSALNPINSTLIATALAPIAHYLHVPAGRTAILVSALYLACSVAQPTAGKLSRSSARAGCSRSASCWCWLAV